MKISAKSFLLLLGAAAILNACDYIKGDKVDPNGFAGSTNKVLIEDFTGHMCGNCPRAHEQAAALLETYGENLVVVAVHAGGFASVVPSLGYGEDFRTPMGTELEQYYGADQQGLPIGMVNRRAYNGGSVLTRFPDWGTQVAAILAEAPKMKIELDPSYNQSNHSVSVDVSIEYQSTGTASHQLVLLITEDDIIAKQSDYDTASQHIDDYVHDHVLRGTITPGTWGVPVKNADIFLGEKFTMSYEKALDSTWVAGNCHIVAYVLDNTTKEILQVEEVTMDN